MILKRQGEERLEGSPSAKQRLEVILETITGELTVSEACEQLGIGESRFHDLRQQTLQATLKALEPRPLGRPAKPISPEQAEIDTLKAGLRRVHADLELAQVQIRLARILNGKRYLIMDRDGKFSEAFREALETEGVEAVRLPPRLPNLNPHVERFIRSIKDESLSRMILFGENMLRSAVSPRLSLLPQGRFHHAGDGYRRRARRAGDLSDLRRPDAPLGRERPFLA